MGSPGGSRAPKGGGGGHLEGAGGVGGVTWRGRGCGSLGEEGTAGDKGYQKGPRVICGAGSGSAAPRTAHLGWGTARVPRTWRVVARVVRVRRERLAGSGGGTYLEPRRVHAGPGRA